MTRINPTAANQNQIENKSLGQSLTDLALITAANVAVFVAGAFVSNAIFGTAFSLRNAAIFSVAWPFVDVIPSNFVGGLLLTPCRMLITAKLTVDLLQLGGLAITAPAWLVTGAYVSSIMIGAVVVVIGGVALLGIASAGVAARQPMR